MCTLGSEQQEPLTARSRNRRKRALSSRGEVNMAYYSVHSTNPTEKNQLSIGRPTQIERRRATRHHFVSAVEVINVADVHL